jgi:hypothetical protein
MVGSLDFRGDRSAAAVEPRMKRQRRRTTRVSEPENFEFRISDFHPPAVLREGGREFKIQNSKFEI